MPPEVPFPVRSSSDAKAEPIPVRGSDSDSPDRRQFVLSSGVVLAGAAASWSPEKNGSEGGGPASGRDASSLSSFPRSRPPKRPRPLKFRVSKGASVTAVHSLFYSLGQA